MNEDVQIQVKVSYNQKESSTNSKGVINWNKGDGSAAMFQALGDITSKQAAKCFAKFLHRF